jgi:hypothetical protein
MMKTNIHNIKGTLAKILAKENILIEHVPGRATASFNMRDRILFLPIWDNISEELYDMIVVHEVGHAIETHWNEFSKLEKAAVEKLAAKFPHFDKSALSQNFHHYVNVVEDIRIDALQKRRYPGAKRDYVIGYKELYDRNFFGTDTHPVEQMIFIDRLNIHTKSGYSGIFVPFTEEERKLVNLATSTKSLEDVINVSYELFVRDALIDQLKPPPQQDEQSDEPDDSEDSGEGGSSGDKSEGSKKKNDEKSDKKDKSKGKSKDKSDDDSDCDDSDCDDSDEGEDSDSDEKSDKKDKSKGKSKDKSDDSEEKSEDSGSGSDGDSEENDDSDEKSESKDNKSSQGSKGASDGAADNSKAKMPRPVTEEAMKAEMERMAGDHARDRVEYVHFPVAKKYVGDMINTYKIWLQEHRIYRSQDIDNKYGRSAKEYQEFLQSESQTISYMIKEFESRKRAKAYNKTQISKTGVIDTNKLHGYLYSEDVFKRNEIVPKGKNHGFVMFIDWSGSMNNVIHSCAQQLISITTFCRRLQIPFEVYSFTSGVMNQIHSGDVYEHDPKAIQLSQGVRINNLLSSKMSASEYNEAMVNLWTIAHHKNFSEIDNMRGTPLCETITLAASLVNEFNKKNRIEISNCIWITDGDGMEPGTRMAGNRKVVIRDTIAKETITFDYKNYAWTNALLAMLKSRTKCNLIGFYVTDSYNKDIVFQGVYTHVNINDLHNEKKSEFQKNGYTKVMNSSYDEYYFIKDAALKIDMDPDFKKFAIHYPNEKDREVTSSKVAKALIKHMEKRGTSRVLLSDFIKRIS